MDLKALQNLIGYHTTGTLTPVVPVSMEARLWELRLAAQERFDTVGLPRGLKVVA